VALVTGAQAIQLDVTDSASVKATIMAIRKAHGRLNILVNNAGLMRPAMIATSAEADLDAMMDTNISIMGREGAVGFSSYTATIHHRP